MDENSDAADRLRWSSESLGNEVRTTYDGMAAMRVAGEFRPDTALLDIGLPGVNTYDVARAMCKEPWDRDMILIALTGWGKEEDLRLSREAGFD